MRRETRSGIVHAMAGCHQCHGGEAEWYGKNALAVAAKHHDATGHTTWCEQAISVRYGPEFEPSPAASPALTAPRGET